MADTDRITESAKHAIVDILNRIVPTEYSFILNYPRIIDQIVKIEGVTDQQLVADLEHLGKASAAHLVTIGQLAARLGGETVAPIDPIERMVDLDSLGEQQLAGEKDAMRLYLEAKQLAEDNPVRSTGLGERLRAIFGADPDPDPAPRGETIRLLEHLASQERTHARIVEDSLATFRAMRKRRD